MKELFEIGFFTCLVNFAGNIWLSLMEWFFVLAGFLAQYILLRKTRRLVTKWIFPCILLAGLVVGEWMVWTVTGWERFFVVIIYGLGVCCMLGLILAWLAHKLPTLIQKRRAMKG